MVAAYHNDSFRNFTYSELELLALVCQSSFDAGPRGYWTSPTSDLAAPAVGLVRSATDYSHTQRVSLMYYTYFNRVVTQRKLRHFPRKTAEANLRSPEGEAPVHHPDTIMPRLATQGMLYDLIPASAATNGQLGVRCQRPDGTLSAAAANRARREQELFNDTKATRDFAMTPAAQTPVPVPAASAQTSVASVVAPPPLASVAPSPTTPPHDHLHYHAYQRMSSSNSTRPPTGYFDYTKSPLRFALPGPAVPLGQSSAATCPTPGNERPGAARIRQPPPPVIDGTAATRAPSLSTSPTDSDESWGLGPFTPGTFDMGHSPEWLARGNGGVGLGLETPPVTPPFEVSAGEQTTLWVCLCGTRNASSADECARTTCRFPRANTEWEDGIEMDLGGGVLNNPMTQADKTEEPISTRTRIEALLGLPTTTQTQVQPTTPPATTATTTTTLTTTHPPAPARARSSALGDPGDWYCDACGLCNWTRRAFCLRCCPLHPDNVGEALTKGLVSPDDPILGVLGYAEKRARALRRSNGHGHGGSGGGSGSGAGGTHCACFGPHHGTRCAASGRGVADNLWTGYLGLLTSVSEVVADMGFTPSSCWAMGGLGGVGMGMGELGMSLLPMTPVPEGIAMQRGAAWRTDTEGRGRQKRPPLRRRDAEWAVAGRSAADWTVAGAGAVRGAPLNRDGRWTAGTQHLPLPLALAPPPAQNRASGSGGSMHSPPSRQGMYASCNGVGVVSPTTAAHHGNSGVRKRAPRGGAVARRRSASVDYQ